MAKPYWIARLGSQMWLVDGIPRRCFIWTPGASKLQGNQLQSGLILKVCSFPTKPLCCVTVPSVGCFQGSSFNTKYFSVHCSHSLLWCFFSSSFSLFLLFSLAFGQNVLWKEVKYLGWSFDGVGNRILDHWPRTPQAQRWDHPGVSWLSPELLPRTVCALGRFCLLEHRAFLHEGDFPFFPAPSPHLLLRARRVSLDHV